MPSPLGRLGEYRLRNLQMGLFLGRAMIWVCCSKRNRGGIGFERCGVDLGFSNAILDIACTIGFWGTGVPTSNAGMGYNVIRFFVVHVKCTVDCAIS
ncbi:hypothetical protein H0G72_05275 [Liberibacter sp. Z1]|nr:hypothetical protein [Candidatus Liberibacter sp.]